MAASPQQRSVIPAQRQREQQTSLRRDARRLRSGALERATSKQSVRDLSLHSHAFPVTLLSQASKPCSACRFSCAISPRSGQLLRSVAEAAIELASDSAILSGSSSCARFADICFCAGRSRCADDEHTCSSERRGQNTRRHAHRCGGKLAGSPSDLLLLCSG